MSTNFHSNIVFFVFNKIEAFAVRAPNQQFKLTHTHIHTRPYTNGNVYRLLKASLEHYFPHFPAAKREKHSSKPHKWMNEWMNKTSRQTDDQLTKDEYQTDQLKQNIFDYFYSSKCVFNALLSPFQIDTIKGNGPTIFGL